MKPKIAIQKIQSLLELPTFTSDEAKKLGVSASSLAYYVKIGELQRIVRGVYRGIHAPAIESFQWEDLMAAIKQTKKGVVCLVSALALYQLTEEIPRQHWIAIPNSTRHRADRFVQVIRMRNMNLGKTEITIGNVTLPIFDRERTIVDAFRYLSKEIAIKALKVALTKKNGEKIDMEKLRKYAEALRVNITSFIMALTT